MGGKSQIKMGGVEAELPGKIKITLWPNLGWGGGCLHSICLTCLRHTNTTATSTIRSAMGHRRACSEGSPSPAPYPALGWPAVLSTSMQDGEGSSGPPGSST